MVASISWMPHVGLCGYGALDFLLVQLLEVFFLSDTSRISSVQGSVSFFFFDISWMKHALVGRHRLQATGRPQTSELVCAAVASDSPLDELSEQLVIGCYLFAA